MEKELKNERYQMCSDQPAQIDCRRNNCAWHKKAACTNVSPAITLNPKGATCWSFKEKPTELENGKVYKGTHNRCLIYKIGKTSGFGFNHLGQWELASNWTLDVPEHWTEATDEEWLEALKKEADRIGLKDGNFKCLSGTTHKGSTGMSLVKHCSAYAIGLNLAMKDGVWAEVVKPEIRISICKHPEQKLILISDGFEQLELNDDEVEYLRNWLNK